MLLVGDCSPVSVVERLVVVENGSTARFGDPLLGWADSIIRLSTTGHLHIQRQRWGADAWRSCWRQGPGTEPFRRWCCKIPGAEKTQELTWSVAAVEEGGRHGSGLDRLDGVKSTGRRIAREENQNSRRAWETKRDGREDEISTATAAGHQQRQQLIPGRPASIHQ